VRVRGQVPVHARASRRGPGRPAAGAQAATGCHRALRSLGCLRGGGPAARAPSYHRPPGNRDLRAGRVDGAVPAAGAGLVDVRIYRRRGNGRLAPCRIAWANAPTAVPPRPVLCSRVGCESIVLSPTAPPLTAPNTLVFAPAKPESSQAFGSPPRACRQDFLCCTHDRRQTQVADSSTPCWLPAMARRFCRH